METLEVQNSNIPVKPVKRKFPVKPYLPLMAVTTIIWGAAFPITRPGLADIPPATFAFLRFAIALAVLLPLVLFVRKGWHFPPKVWGKVALGGVLGFSFIQLCQNWGLTFSTASDISILAATEPVSIALLAAYFLHEKPARSVWLGLAISLFGVLLVLGINPLTLLDQPGSGVGNNRLLGDLMFLGGTLGFASYNVINRNLTQRYDGLEVTSGAVIFGVVALAPFCLFEVVAGTRPVNFTFSAVSGILYSALLVTVFGFLALSWSVKRVPAARVALLFYLQPVSGVLISLAAGEKLTLNFATGAALILTGVFVAEHFGD